MVPCEAGGLQPGDERRPGRAVAERAAARHEEHAGPVTGREGRELRDPACPEDDPRQPRHAERPQHVLRRRLQPAHREGREEARERLAASRLCHPARDRGPPRKVVRRVLVRRRRRGVPVGFVQDEPGRVVGRLQDVEPEAARLRHGAGVVRPGGLDEVGDVLREHVDVDQRDVHRRHLLTGA